MIKERRPKRARRPPSATIMADTFDPYYKWLAIPPDEQPPNHYRLLGVQRFEADTDVIATAADQRMAHLRTFQTGKHGADSQRLLNEISAARVCLLNPARKVAYDQQLRANLTPPAPAGPAAPPLASGGPYGSPAATAPLAAPPVVGYGAAPQTPLGPLAPPPAISRSGHGLRPVPLSPPAAASTALEPDDVDLQSGSGRQLGGLQPAWRPKKKKQSSLGLLGGLAAVGIVALLAIVALVSSRPAPPAHDPASSAEASHPQSEHRHKPATVAQAEPAADEQIEPESTEPESSPSESSPSESTMEDETPPAERPKPKDELLSPAARRLLAEVSQHVSAGAAEQSDPAGGTGGTPFEEIPIQGALLVGLNLTEGDFAGHTILRAVQAIYLGPEGLLDGEPHGNFGSDHKKLLARPGYAVGGMKVSTGARIDGLALVFMRVRADRLDPDDAYESEWVGGKDGGAPIRIEGQGRPAVGLYGAVGVDLDRIGLMLDAQAPSAAAAMPTPDMPESRPLVARPQLLANKARLPVPSAEAQKESLGLIHTLFRDDYTDAGKGPQQKMALAVKLFHKAEETNDDPVARYVLICEARDLAARCGDSLAVADAIMLLANNYQIDDVGMTLAAFDKAAEVTTAPAPFRRKLVENCILLTDRAVAQEKYEVAEQLLAIGRRAALKANDGILTQRIGWRAAKLREQKAAYESVREPLEVLQTQPDNRAALGAVGRYRCFYQDDWRVGLPLLAKGSDAALADVAAKELANPGDSDDQLKLAEAWDAAGKADEHQRPQCERRAKYWYARAIVGLRGIVKAKAEKRLDELLGGRGLKGEYFRGENLTANERLLTRIDPNLDFKWGEAAPAPDVPNDHYSVRWTGLLAMPNKGEYQLTIEHDDGVRIWIDGKIVIDRWNDRGTGRAMIPSAGKARAIKVEYHDAEKGAQCVLKWSQKGGFSEQVIPPEAFWQEHATGKKDFAPLPNPPYPTTMTALPGRNPAAPNPDEP